MTTNRWIQLPPRDPPPPPPAPPEFIDEGRYLLEILSVEEAKSSHGNPYYKLECKVISPLVDPEFRIWLILSLTDKAMWRMRDFLEALWDTPVEGMTYVRPTDWIGKRFRAHISIVEYGGRLGNRIGNLYACDPQDQR